MANVRRTPLLVLILAVFSSCFSVALSPPDEQLAGDVEELVAQRMADGSFAGVVLVAKGRQVIHHGAYGLADRGTNRRNTLSTCFDVASLGKMFTAVGIAQLAEQRRLQFDDLVGEYLPASLRQTEIGRRVTFHQLLTHTSGVPDLPDSLFNDPPDRLSDYEGFFQTQKLEFEPGTKRAYSNGGFILLGMVIEKVSGQTYEEYMRRHIFDPAGMTDVAFTPGQCRAPAAMGYFKEEGSAQWTPNGSRIAEKGGPHGGALTTASDLHRFFLALRTGALLSREMAARVTTPQLGATSAYGFGVLNFDTDRLVGHSGGNTGVSADAYVYWTSGYTIVVLSNLDPPASHNVAGAIRKLIEPRFARSS
jgi:CubicO group peptidase (beta-lactamase class C family)